MTIEDHSTEQSANVDPMDEIAGLLLGGDEPGDEAQADPAQEQTQDTPDTEDEDDAEELSDASTESEEDEPESDEEADDTEEEDQTLAQMLGVAEDQILVDEETGAFKLKTKIDGEESTVNLAEVLKNHQTESSVTNKSKALAEERKKFEEAVTTKATEIQQTLQRNQQLSQMLEEELMADYDKVDWDDLREFDPAEWSAKRQEFGLKYQKIQSVKGELETQVSEAQAETQKKITEQRETYVKGQWDALVSKNPTWVDENVYEKDMGELRSFGKEAYGFNDADFNAVYDARLIEMIKDAKAYRAGSTVAKKKLKSVPKIQKRGGVRKATKLSKLDKLTKVAKNARGSGRRQAETDAVAELLMGG